MVTVGRVRSEGRRQKGEGDVLEIPRVLASHPSALTVSSHRFEIHTLGSGLTPDVFIAITLDWLLGEHLLLVLPAFLWRHRVSLRWVYSRGMNDLVGQISLLRLSVSLLID